MSSHSFRSSSNHRSSPSKPNLSVTTTMAETQAAPPLAPMLPMDASPPRSGWAFQLPPLNSLKTSSSKTDHAHTHDRYDHGLSSLHLASIHQSRSASHASPPWDPPAAHGSASVPPEATNIPSQSHFSSRPAAQPSPHNEYDNQHSAANIKPLLPKGAGPQYEDFSPQRGHRARGSIDSQHAAFDNQSPQRRHHASSSSPTFHTTHQGHHLSGVASVSARQYPLVRHTSSDAVYTRGEPQESPRHHMVALAPAINRSAVPYTVEPPYMTYELRVRQQPIAARACGFGERDRRVIDPPPIIELVVRDKRTGTAEIDELRHSLGVVHCTLWNFDGTREETALEQPDRRKTRRLMGQLVASPSVAKDEHDVEGCFFCFPDLSCRTNGRYRLRFVMMQLDPANLHVGGYSPILCEVLSDVFTVYTAKDFPGMRPSSALTRALKLQGCNIQVKKGNEKALARKRQSFGELDHVAGGGKANLEDDEGEEGPGAAKRPRQDSM